VPRGFEPPTHGLGTDWQAPAGNLSKPRRRRRGVARNTRRRGHRTQWQHGVAGCPLCSKFSILVAPRRADVDDAGHPLARRRPCPACPAQGCRPSRGAPSPRAHAGVGSRPTLGQVEPVYVQAARTAWSWGKRWSGVQVGRGELPLEWCGDLFLVLLETGRRVWSRPKAGTGPDWLSPEVLDD